MTPPERNPFVYGGPVDVQHFVGRQQEVNLVFEQVTQSVPGCVAVVGERRIGKTSLMHYVAAPDVMRRWNLEEQSSIFLFVDCGAIAPMTITGFWQDILTRLRRQLERRTRYGHHIEKIQSLLAKPEIRTSEIEFLIEDMQGDKLLLVILLDEFEWVVRTDAESENTTRELLGGLRALVNNRARTLSLIIATRRPLDEVCRDLRFMGSPFYNNFVYLHLRAFSETEANSLLEQMLKGTAVVFTAPERRLIQELAGTHPLLLQASAACIFDARREAIGAPLDRRVVLEKFMDLTEHQWLDMWRWSSDAEQELLMRLARHPHDGSTVLDNQPGECRALLKRGLIVADKGVYRLFSPTLRHWLLELTAESMAQGSVAPRTGVATARKRKRSMVFVSYSHKNEAEKDALLTHLRVLQKGTDCVEVWSDDDIGGGEAWEAAIEKAVARARVAILLVSADFLSSDFILKKEVPSLLARREKTGVTVIPVIARACAWKKIEWLSRMNVRPKNGLPVWSGAGATHDEALAKIAEEVASILDAK
jgi:hypothetical protein